MGPIHLSFFFCLFVLSLFFLSLPYSILLSSSHCFLFVSFLLFFVFISWIHTLYLSSSVFTSLSYFPSFVIYFYTYLSVIYLLNLLILNSVSIRRFSKLIINEKLSPPLDRQRVVSRIRLSQKIFRSRQKDDAVSTTVASTEYRRRLMNDRIAINMRKRSWPILMYYHGI